MLFVFSIPLLYINIREFNRQTHAVVLNLISVSRYFLIQFSLPSISFSKSFVDLCSKLIVFQSPIRCDQQFFGRLGNKSLHNE